MNLQSILQNEKGVRQVVERKDTKIMGQPVNQALVHQVVTAYLSNQREQSYQNAGASNSSWNKKLHWKKTRSDVSGGGRKPRPQKGSGRARMGTTRSPICIGGGMTFASGKPNFFQKVNKKMYRAAMCSIFSALHQEQRIFVGEVVINDFKTKSAVQWFAQHNIEQNALIVTNDFNENLFLSMRNLPNVLVVTPDQVNPVLLLKHRVVIMHPEALNIIEEICS